MPIILGEKLWGLLIVHHCRSQRHWQSYEIELLQQLATQVAIALQQSELYSRVQAELIERQRIEKELRVSEQRYRSVVTAMSEGIILQQADGQIIACNLSAENILGRSAQQILGQIGMNWGGQIIQEDGSPFPSQEHPAMVTLRTGKPQVRVIMGISPPEASLLPCPVNDSPVAGNKAKSGGLKLRQKQQGCQEQRHEITWISMNSQPLFNPGDSQPYAVVTSFSDITESKRHFSRLDEAKCKQVNLHQGIDSTLLILKHRLTQKGNRPPIQLIKDYGQLPLVKCYPGQLNQVFMNILSNALDALDDAHDTAYLSGLPSTKTRDFQDTSKTHPQPSPMIRIHTEFVEPNWIIIRIADNGAGINAEVQSRIFDPFFTTKPVGQGTGLGLSISYQIVVDKHGGQLQCHSHHPQGTEFVIKLPVTKSL